jgi:DNA end-binding protein Ku
MAEENKVGIAKVVLGEKESLIALRASGKDMLLSTLYFADEIKKSPANEIKTETDPKELKLAKAIINGMNEPFNPAKYRDEYKEKLLQAIEMKIEGKEISMPEEKINKTADLMDALQASLSGLKGGKNKGARLTQ